MSAVEFRPAVWPLDGRTGRPDRERSTVICKCRTAAQIAVDALLSGESKGCGCRLPLGHRATSAARRRSHQTSRAMRPTAP